MLDLDIDDFFFEMLGGRHQPESGEGWQERAKRALNSFRLSIVHLCS